MTVAAGTEAAVPATAFDSRTRPCTRSSRRCPPRLDSSACWAGSSTSRPTPPAATPASSTSWRATGSCCAPPRRATRSWSARSSWACDEGLTGWVARTKTPEFIRDDALGDPRMKYVPELEEERFQSMVAVPILATGRRRDRGGVLHTEAPREFDDDVLNFLVHTASLVAGAIENAQLFEETRRRVDALTTLTQLSQALAAVTLPRGPLRRRHTGRARSCSEQGLPDLAARAEARRRSWRSSGLRTAAAALALSGAGRPAPSDVGADGEGADRAARGRRRAARHALLPRLARTASEPRTPSSCGRWPIRPPSV